MPLVGVSFGNTDDICGSVCYVSMKCVKLLFELSRRRKVKKDLARRDGTRLIYILEIIF